MARGDRNKTSAPDPNKKITQVDSHVLRELQASTKGSPIDFSDSRFELRSLVGLAALKPKDHEFVDVSNNELTDLNGLQKFSYLRKITARHNKLTSAGWVVLRFNQLTELDVSKNSLTFVPDLSATPHLMVLDLSDNVIGGNFHNLFVLSKLRSLQLSGNRLKWTESDFVKGIENLGKNIRNLDDLSLKGNLRQPSSTYQQTIRKALPGLQTLDYEKFSVVKKKSLGNVAPSDSQAPKERRVEDIMSQGQSTEETPRAKARTGGGTTTASPPVEDVSTRRRLGSLLNEVEGGSPPTPGSPLSRAAPTGRVSGYVPSMYSSCMTYLNQRGPPVSAIFRKSANPEEVEAARKAYHGGKIFDFGNVHDPHVVANIVKDYFREMVKPICTFELYPYFLEVAKSSSPENEQVQMIKSLISEIKEDDQAILKETFFLLRKIAVVPENGMTSSKLASVFGFLILRPQQAGTEELIRDTKLITSVVTQMIDRADDIFGHIVAKTGSQEEENRAAASSEDRPPRQERSVANPVRNEEPTPSFSRSQYTQEQPTAQQSQLHAGSPSQSDALSRSHEDYNNRELRSKLESSERALRDAEDENKRLKDFADRRGATLDSRGEEAAQLSAKVDRLERQLREKDSEINALERSNSDKNLLIMNLRAEKEAIQRELDREKARGGNSEDIEALKDKIRILERDNLRLYEKNGDFDVSRMGQDITRLKEEKSDLENRIERLQEEREYNKQAISRLESELVKANNRMEEELMQERNRTKFEQQQKDIWKERASKSSTSGGIGDSGVDNSVWKTRYESQEADYIKLNEKMQERIKELETEKMHISSDMRRHAAKADNAEEYQSKMSRLERQCEQLKKDLDEEKGRSRMEHRDLSKTSEELSDMRMKAQLEAQKWQNRAQEAEEALNAQRRAKDREIKSLNEELQHTRDRLSEMESNIRTGEKEGREKLRTRVAELEASMTGKKGEMDDMVTLKQRYEHALDDTQKNNERLLNSNRELDGELKNLRIQLRQWRSKAEELESKYQPQAEERLLLAEKDLSRLKEDLKSKNDELRDQAYHMELERDRWDAEMKRWKNKVDELGETIDGERWDLVKELEATKEDLAKVQNALRDKTDELISATRDRFTGTDEAFEWKQRFEHSNLEMMRMQDRLATKQEEIEDVKAQWRSDVSRWKHKAEGLTEELDTHASHVDNETQMLKRDLSKIREELRQKSDDAIEKSYELESLRTARESDLRKFRLKMEELETDLETEKEKFKRETSVRDKEIKRLQDMLRNSADEVDAAYAEKAKTLTKCGDQLAVMKDELERAVRDRDRALSALEDDVRGNQMERRMAEEERAAEKKKATEELERIRQQLADAENLSRERDRQILDFTERMREDDTARKNVLVELEKISGERDQYALANQDLAAQLSELDRQSRDLADELKRTFEEKQGLDRERSAMQDYVEKVTNDMERLKKDLEEANDSVDTYRAELERTNTEMMVRTQENKHLEGSKLEAERMADEWREKAKMLSTKLLSFEQTAAAIEASLGPAGYSVGGVPNTSFVAGKGVHFSEESRTPHASGLDMDDLGKSTNPFRSNHNAHAPNAFVRLEQLAGELRAKTTECNSLRDIVDQLQQRVRDLTDQQVANSMKDNNIDRIKGEIEASDERAHLRIQVEKLTRDLMSKAEDADLAARDANKLREEISVLNGTVTDLSGKVEDANQRLHIAQEEIEGAATNNRKLVELITQRDKDIDVLNERIEFLENQAKKRANQYEAGRFDKDLVNRHVARLESELSEKATQLEQMNSELSRSKYRESETKDKLDRCSLELNSLRVEYENVEKRLKRKMDDLETLLSKCGALEDEKEKLSLRVRHLEGNIESTVEQMGHEMERALREKEAKLARQSKEAESRADKASHYKREAAQLQRELQEKQQLVKSLQKRLDQNASGHSVKEEELLELMDEIRKRKTEALRWKSEAEMLRTELEFKRSSSGAEYRPKNSIQ